MGGNLAKGACPLAISSMVMPTDQMSALLLYLQQHTWHQRRKSGQQADLATEAHGKKVYALLLYLRNTTMLCC